MDQNSADQSGHLSDGYHTFDELYAHRFELFFSLCREICSNPRYQCGQKSEVWRSTKHSDGGGYPGWFLLGIGKAKGEQITYHIPMARWGECGFAQTLDIAPDWDGHTSDDVLKRLALL